MGNPINQTIMKTFFASVWKYIAVFFAGIIAGLVAAIKMQGPDTTIIAHNYVAEQNQETKIGKVKNNGSGSQTVDQSPSINNPEIQPSRREQRIARRAARRAKRELNTESESEDSESAQCTG